MYEYRKLNPVQRADLLQQRTARGYPLHSPPHPIQDQPVYLLTAACFEHASHMQSQERRQEVLSRLFELLIEQGIEIPAWVVLPNHYHLLAQAPDLAVLGAMFRLVHGPTARTWNEEDGAPGRRVGYRFADRAIRSERHYHTTLNYIHYNPVKHGWAKSPYDWAESSVHWYLEHRGREWLRDLWARYPVRDYGHGWDWM